jgi:hypothetical protein
MTVLNSLLEKSPEIAAQAYGWDPREVSSTENKVKRAFQCELGHVWDARVYDRVRLNSGCQVCANRIIVVGFNDLKTTHPELASQSFGWDARSVHKGMTSKKNWKCELGHVWEAQIIARASQNQGCPFCSNRRTLAGFNDLATKFPEIAKMAHKWDPTRVSPSDKELTEWICSFEHITKTPTYLKVRHPSCRVCSGLLLQVGANDLATTHAAIAAQAFDWDPAMHLPSSSALMNWKCDAGHVYTKKINARIRSGCPTCSGKSVQSGFNDLMSKKPEIAKEAHGWDPTSITWGSKKVLEWKCPKGHVYAMAVSLRTGNRPQKSPICAGKRVLNGYNDLVTRYPEIAKEAHGWDPRTTSPGTHRKLEWKCRNGHLFTVSPNQRTSRTSNCPTCANLIVETGFNDLATTHPNLAIEAFGWDPKLVSGGSSMRLQWKCSSEHTWESTPVNRTWNKTGCPICVNQLLLVGYNDLLSINPRVAAEAYGWDPVTVMAGAKKAMNWKCPKGHVYRASVANRTQNETGCPVCINAKVLIGFNDLVTTHPKIASEAFGWDPRTVVAGSNSRKRWKCGLGHDWITAPANRTSQKQSCPFCANLRAWPGFNDLFTKYPLIAREALGWDPTKVMPGSAKKMRWKCPEGHVYWSPPTSRTGARRSGCAKCANSGFNQHDKGYIYFLKHETWEMYQIGITNVPERRLAKHAKLGWEAVEVRGPMDGLAAMNWETAMLRMLKAKGAKLGSLQISGKFDGYTESWTKSSFQTSGLKHLMEKTDEYDLEKTKSKDTRKNSRKNV